MKIFKLFFFFLLLSSRIGTSIAQSQQCIDGMTSISADSTLRELDVSNACAEKLFNEDGTSWDCTVDGSSNAQAYNNNNTQRLIVLTTTAKRL
jgi:hypothetical protein